MPPSWYCLKLSRYSKAEYEDDEVDEFDAEAPPHTKNVHLDRSAVWNKFCTYLFDKFVRVIG